MIPAPFCLFTITCHGITAPRAGADCSRGLFPNTDLLYFVIHFEPCAFLSTIPTCAPNHYKGAEETLQGVAASPLPRDCCQVGIELAGRQEGLGTAGGPGLPPACSPAVPRCRVRGPQPLPPVGPGSGLPRRNHVRTDHPTHVQVGGNRPRCLWRRSQGPQGIPVHAAPYLTRAGRGDRLEGVRLLLPPSHFQGKPAPPAGRARLSPRLALGGARLSPAARLGARLGSAAAAARAFLRSSGRGRARPARAHAGHQVRGGRRRVSAPRGAAGRSRGGSEDPGWAGRVVPGRGRPHGAARGAQKGAWQASSPDPPDAAGGLPSGWGDQASPLG